MIREILYVKKKWEENCVFLNVAGSRFSIKIPLGKAERKISAGLVLSLPKLLQVEGIQFFFAGRRQLLQPSFLSRSTTWFTSS